MDVTLFIAIAAATLSVVLFGALVFALVGLAMALRSRGEAAAPPHPEPGPAPAKAQPRAFDSLDPSVEGHVSDLRSEQQPGAGHLIGFFDDETHSAPGLKVRDELQRARVPAAAFHSVPPQRVDLDDSEEAEATEIFSASQLGSEFAEFLDDPDEPAPSPKGGGAS